MVLAESMAKLTKESLLKTLPARSTAPSKLALEFVKVIEPALTEAKLVKELFTNISLEFNTALKSVVEFDIPTELVKTSSENLV
jgi:hypothetical protein